MKIALIILPCDNRQEVAGWTQSLLLGNEVRLWCDKSISDTDGKKIDKLLHNTLGQGISSRRFVKVLDEIYNYTKEENEESFIIPIDNWKLLYNIKQSFLQLSDKNIVFVLSSDDADNKEEFMGLVRYLDRFRNIHICLDGSSGKFNQYEKCYNLHFLHDENINDIIQLHINNRRKYIGWKYHVNELRQKIKFNKDLLKHLLMTHFFHSYEEKMDKNVAIPKIIHYCWFGGKPLPADVKRCIDTWRVVAPDYEIKCWSEANFPFEKYRFAQEALQHQKWAFIADVARLHALYYEGGIYLDTDVELLKPFDNFLNEDGFTSYESLNLIAMAAIGFKKYHPWLADMILWYQNVHCDDDYTEIANTKVVSKITKLNYGAKLDGTEKIVGGLHIYPREFFSPKLNKDKWITTDNTHCIHHFTGMW